MSVWEGRGELGRKRGWYTVRAWVGGRIRVGGDEAMASVV